MVKKRRRHSVAYKFRVALEALKGSKTIRQLSTESKSGDGTCCKTGPSLKQERENAKKSRQSSPKLNNTTRPVQMRSHPSGCTLFFPFRGLTIGANHTVSLL